MKEPVRIFLSYARQDKEEVGCLYQRLSRAGFKPWMDAKNILPGEWWSCSIRRAIRESHFFLVCLSENSVNKRGWIQREIKEALDVWEGMLESDIYLIPVLLRDCEAPESLSGFQLVDLCKDDGWERLIEAVQAGTERRAGGPISSTAAPIDSDMKTDQFPTAMAVTDIQQTKKNKSDQIELLPQVNRCLKLRRMVQKNLFFASSKYRTVSLIIVVSVLVSSSLAIFALTRESPAQWAFCVHRSSSETLVEAGDEITTDPDEPLILTLCTADGTPTSVKRCHWESSAGRIDNSDRCKDVVYHAPHSNSDILILTVEDGLRKEKQLAVKVSVKY